jgi:hypothetical protein
VAKNHAGGWVSGRGEPRRPSLGVHGTETGVGFLQPEAGADHGVLACVVPELDVGRGDDRAVGEEFRSWIAAVARYAS